MPARIRTLRAAATAGALLTLALALTSPAHAGPGKDDKDPGDDPRNDKTGGVRLITKTLPGLLAGQEGWIGAVWTAETDVCDVQVTATSPGLEIAYPENTGKFSSFYTNAALAEGNIDFTALKFTAPPRNGDFNVRLTVAFTRLADPQALTKSDDLVRKDVVCKGTRATTTVDTDLFVRVPPIGPDAVLLTGERSVPRAAPTWISLNFLGVRPGLDDFRVTVDAPEGFEVVYPGDGSSSGLNDYPTLGVARRDSAAVRLDPGEAEPGKYKVPVVATWKGGQLEDSLTVEVTR